MRADGRTSGRADEQTDESKAAMAVPVDSVVSEIARVAREAGLTSRAAPADLAAVAERVLAEVGDSGTMWAMARVPVIRRHLAERLHAARSYSTVCAFFRSEAPDTVVTVTPRTSSSS